MENKGVLIKDMPDGAQKQIAEKLIQDFLEEAKELPNPWSWFGFQYGDIIAAKAADRSKVVLIFSWGNEADDVASAQRAGIMEPEFGYAGSWFREFFPDGVVVKDLSAEIKPLPQTPRNWCDD